MRTPERSTKVKIDGGPFSKLFNQRKLLCALLEATTQFMGVLLGQQTQPRCMPTRCRCSADVEVLFRTSRVTVQDFRCDWEECDDQEKGVRCTGRPYIRLGGLERRPGISPSGRVEIGGGSLPVEVVSIIAILPQSGACISILRSPLLLALPSTLFLIVWALTALSSCSVSFITRKSGSDHSKRTHVGCAICETETATHIVANTS